MKGSGRKENPDGAYTALPEFYDFLGEHPDYGNYAEKVLALYEAIGAKESGLILDLACGTGKLICELTARGADVIGVDASCEMLTVARENCARRGFSPLLLQQDMRRLDLYGTVDVCVCATNSLNYLTSAADLRAVFALVHNFLTPGGLFVFDVNSLYKFEKLYGDNTYAFEAGGAYCVWQNDYRPARRECSFLLTIFRKEGELYRRREEAQKQKYFSPRTISRTLKETGFELLRRAAGPDGGEVKEDCADVFYTARCVKEET